MEFFQNLIYKFIFIRQVLKYLKRYGIVNVIPEITSIDYSCTDHIIERFLTNNSKIKEITFRYKHICVRLNDGNSNFDECFHFKQYFNGLKITPEYYEIRHNASICQRVFFKSKETRLVIEDSNLDTILKLSLNYIKMNRVKSTKIEVFAHWSDDLAKGVFVAIIEFYKPLLNSTVNFNFNKFMSM